MFDRSTILVVCLGLSAAACASQSSGLQSSAPPASPQTTAVTPSSSPATTASAPNTTASSPNTPAINDSITPGIRSACGFLEDSEISAVQGAPVQSRTPNQQTTAGRITSQCYYTVVTDKAANLSVHLQVMESDPKTPNAVRDYWEESLDLKNMRRLKKGKDVPQPVANVGDEAVWVDSGKSGVLYALQKQKLVRVSVGGGVDSKSRLEKSKQLMTKALRRVS